VLISLPTQTCLDAFPNIIARFFSRDNHGFLTFFVQFRKKCISFLTYGILFLSENKTKKGRTSYMSMCTKCGAALPDTAKFCTICGTPVAPSIPNETPAFEPEQHSVLQQVPSEAKLVSPNEAAPSPSAPESVEPSPVAPAPNPVPESQPQAASTAFAQAKQSGVKQPTAYEQAYQPKQTQGGPTIFPADRHPYQQTPYQNPAYDPAAHDESPRLPS
jgi:hypothetical protein